MTGIIKRPVRMYGHPPPSFQHTYHRDLAGDNPQPATVVCEPSLYLPRNHIDCVLRHCHRPLRYENGIKSSADFPDSPFSPSLKALLKDLPNGISFVGDRGRVRPLTKALFSSLATPQEAYDRAGLDRLGQNLYDVFMARWNKALWEHDEVCFGWGTIDDTTLHAAAKFQACRLVNLYRSFAPHFTKEAWEKMGGSGGRTWESGTRTGAEGAAPELVLDGIAVLTTNLGCMLSEVDMAKAIVSTEPNLQRAWFDATHETVSWEGHWVEDKMRKVWLEIFRLFHLYRVRYVLAYSGVRVQLYYLNQTNEVFVSPSLHCSVAEDYPNSGFLTLLLALAVVPEPAKEDEGLFIPLERTVSSSSTSTERNQHDVNGINTTSQLDHSQENVETEIRELILEFPNSNFRLDLSEHSFRHLQLPTLQPSSPYPQLTNTSLSSLKVAGHFDSLTFLANSSGTNHHPSNNSGLTVSLGNFVSYGRLWTVWDGFLFDHSDRKESTQLCDHWQPVAIKFAFPRGDLCYEREVAGIHGFTVEKPESAILNEASLYEGPLKELQGIVVPRYYGVFRSGSVSCMILEKVGDKLPAEDWRSLSRDHREAMLYAYSRLHSQRVLHKDIELRHFCRDLSDDSGAGLRLIDFDGSKFGTDKELRDEWRNVWDLLVGC